jgi:hypothetical protein
MNRVERINNTPWGPATLVEPLIPGQVFAVSTAGHGGLYVTGAALDRIPAVFRRATFTRSENWFEEDVDWAIVARFLPELFPHLQREAEAILREYFAATYAAWAKGAEEVNRV